MNEDSFLESAYEDANGGELDIYDELEYWDESYDYDSNLEESDI